MLITVNTLFIHSIPTHPSQVCEGYIWYPYIKEEIKALGSHLSIHAFSTTKWQSLDSNTGSLILQCTPRLY